jgi:hypothetical protein
VSRFNNPRVPQVGPHSAVETTDERVRTFEGAQGYKRTPKSALFLLAASFMGGDDNFYEKSRDRYEHLLLLIQEEEVYTDLEWSFRFVDWLRNKAQMRTVSMVVAVEVVRARLAHDLTEPIDVAANVMFSGRVSNRDVINYACSRADEPAEVLAYWLHKYGKPIPWPIKNGVADAAVRLYNQYSYIKYGNSKNALLNMRDVLRLTHPEAKDERQNALFSHIVGAEIVGPESLPVLYNRKRLYGIDKEDRLSVVENPQLLKDAGMTWENVSEWYPGGMNADAWNAIIPNMGVMALIRNLRNFDQVGISQESVAFVEKTIRDPEVVRRSRQLPFRWYNAYRAVESVRWATALDEALTYSLVNIPKLDGKTLVLVDMSGSMFHSRVSPKSDVLYADAAALFGTALKLANPHGVDLYQFGSDYDELRGRYINRFGRRFGDDGNTWSGVTREIALRIGGSVLRGMEKFHDMGGTEIHKAIAETVRSEHNRIILLTDEQGWSTNYDDLPIPANRSLYVWNFGGYESGITRSGRYHRHTMGGLTDASFQLIPILEAGRNARWPWEYREENGQALKK